MLKGKNHINALTILLFGFWACNGLQLIVANNIQVSKFSKIETPKSDLLRFVEKEFKSPSISKLTCAAYSQIMEKQAYNFNEEEQLCQVLDKIPSSFESKSQMINVWIIKGCSFNQITNQC